MLTGAGSRALSKPVSERVYSDPIPASVRLLNSAAKKRKNLSVMRVQSRLLFCYIQLSPSSNAANLR
jgi:hypothetical protein